MDCQHKPRNTLLIKYDPENGLHFCGKNELCRFCGARIRPKRRGLLIFWAVLLWTLPFLLLLTALLLFDTNLYDYWVPFLWFAPIAAVVFFFEGSLLFRWEIDPIKKRTSEKEVDGFSMDFRGTARDNLELPK